MPFLYCHRCSVRGRECPDDVYQYTCSRCAMAMVFREAKAELAERSLITGSMIKAAIKKKKWSQNALSTHLHIPMYKVSRAATDKEAPCQEIVDWVHDVLTQEEMDACLS